MLFACFASYFVVLFCFISFFPLLSFEFNSEEVKLMEMLILFLIFVFFLAFAML